MNSEDGIGNASDCKSQIAAEYRSLTALLRKSGISSRAILTGVWMATIDELLNSIDPAYLGDYLDEVAAATRGMGVNADSAMETLSQTEQEDRLEQARSVAETVTQKIAPILDAFDDARFDASRLFVELGFDILRSSWGGHHFRRIVAMQSDAIAQDILATIAPLEPAGLNSSGRRKTEVVKPDAPEVPVAIAAPGAPLAAILSPPSTSASIDLRTAPIVDVAIRIDVDVDRHDSIYAIMTVARSRGGERSEVRETTARSQGDTNGRSATLLAVYEAFAPFQGLRCRISVDTSSLMIVEGMTGESTRLPVLDGPVGWSDVDEVVVGHNINWTLSGRHVDGDLSERTDRSLRLARGAMA